MSQAFAFDVRCRCIQALREIRGIDIRGNANTIPVTHSLNEATEGDVLLWNTRSGDDHGDEIIGFEGQVHMGTHYEPEYILVWGCNWTPCKCGERKVKWDDERLKGVYRPLSTTYAK